VEPEELAVKLKDMYFNSLDGESVLSIHLFGIKYASEISKCGTSPANIAKLAGVPETYGVEINKGRNLAKYVVLK